MIWIRFFWPSLLAIILIAYYLWTVLGRSGAQLSRIEVFRSRNEDGPFTLGVLGILFLLLLGAQFTMLRTASDLVDLRFTSDRTIGRLRMSNQEWSLKHRSAQSSLDSLRLALERDGELRDATPFDGRVIDERSREAIEGAVVKVARHDPAMREKVRIIADDVVSDGSGRFRILVPRLGPSGTLRAEIAAEGYEPGERWFTAADSLRNLTFYVTPR